MKALTSAVGEAGGVGSSPPPVPPIQTTLGKMLYFFRWRIFLSVDKKQHAEFFLPPPVKYYPYKRPAKQGENSFPPIPFFNWHSRCLTDVRQRVFGEEAHRPQPKNK
jgi:hypothetical protein